MAEATEDPSKAPNASLSWRSSVASAVPAHSARVARHSIQSEALFAL
jgi:hypothetical protein